MRIVLLNYIMYSFIFVLFICFGCESNQDKNLNYFKDGQTYILKFPTLEMGEYKPYKAKTLDIFHLRVVVDKEKMFFELIQPTNNYVLSSVLAVAAGNKTQSVPPDKRLKISIIDDGTICIDGYIYYQTGGMCKLNFVGKIDQKNTLLGTGIISLGGFGQIMEKYRDLYSVNWLLYLDGVEVKNPDDIYQVKLTRTISSPDFLSQVEQDEKIKKITEITDRAYKPENIPLIEQYDLKHAIQYSEQNRLQNHFSSRENYREKIKYTRDKILTDIDWNEIGYLPKLFFAIDHLTTINEDKETMDYLLRGMFRDEGVIALENDFRSWVRIPLLFLFVYYNDWLTPERVERLNKLSNRIRLIIEEVKKYGNDSPNKLDEIMISVLSKLSDQERRDYFVKSIKLRNYVTESNNLSLQKLMPNDLPPPPGPPENMRDWYNGDGKLRRGAFVRLEDDPKRGKVLIILDADRIELRLGFDDMSKETQRYITEMLEAQAEDAAEAEKNKTTPKN